MNADFPDPMDASLLQLERELQSLTPVAPGRDLLLSLHARMEPSEPAPQANRVHSFPWRRMMAPAAAAAAAVAVMSINNNNRRAGSSQVKPVVAGHDEDVSAIKWTPMPMRREYRALLDSGYVILDENMEPAKHYLMNALDQHEWRDSEHNSSIRLTIPRQLLVPAGAEDREAIRRAQQLQFQ